MKARAPLLACAALAAAGCITYDDVPLATARVEGVAPCVGCRSAEAVVVSVMGDDALPYASMVVHDLRITYDLGQHPAALVRADERGRWKATLRGLRVPGRSELPVLPGDVLEVFQKDGDGDASPPYRVTVPAPAEERHDTPPIIPQEPQAAEPWPNPSGS